MTARWSRGLPTRLLGLVVALTALVTATLTLDATVVLLTPVVLATTVRLAVPTRPHSYACAHLANSGSLLLPVSNLTNLLAFTASGLTFTRFAAAMSLPWLLACTLDWGALRLAFRRDVLAVLVGVNLGPNATFPGSLATLLWRRTLPAADRPRPLEFHALGLLSTPVSVAAVTAVLWLVAGPLSLR